MSKLNPDCDGSKCIEREAELRILPTSADREMGSNAIYCEACFKSEMYWRRNRNRHLSPSAHFPIVDWKDLEVYHVVHGDSVETLAKTMEEVFGAI
jgi:hypothetical protein